MPDILTLAPPPRGDTAEAVTMDWNLVGRLPRARGYGPAMASERAA